MNLIKVLVVDDSKPDAILLARELERAGYSVVTKRVDTPEDMERALVSEKWDVILCDYIMPHFSGPLALELLHKKGLDIPIIIVSGQVGEDAAVEAMKLGANDYVMKTNLKRLGPVVEREIAEANGRRQRRKAEQELKAKEEELRVARKIDAIKDEFIGLISHELKTPLTVIIGAANVATSDGVSQEEAREMMEEVARSAEALSAMVDNLLELSRYQSDRLNLQAKQISVEPIIHSVIDKLNNKSSIHHLAVELPHELPLVSVDSIRIERVLYNLIENAIKYSPKGGEVRVSGRHQNGQLIVGVSDQGIGIKPEDQPKLFQSFQRLEVQNKYDISGVGLGLRVCQILVEAHGGRIWVESTPGVGSTFYFALPSC